MDNYIKDYRQVFHNEYKIFPEYMEGFNSDENSDNPYELPLKINLEQIRIGMKEGPLTDEEKMRLRQLREIMDMSQWGKWNWGNYLGSVIEH